MAFASPTPSDLLFPLCKEGHADGVRRLLEVNASVDQVDGHGRTALYHACRQGHRQCAELLIAAGASINQATHKGNTPLLAACHHGHLECAHLLLDASAAADHADNDGYTPLLISSRQGFLACASLLLDAKASVDRAMNGGFTPLFAACNQGHRECVSLLLEAAATVDQATAHGTTPLLTACQLGHLDCVRLLSVHGAHRPENLEANAISRGHLAVAAWLERSRDWCSALHHLDVLQPEKARRLLRQGADLHASVRPGAARQSQERPPPQPTSHPPCPVTGGAHAARRGWREAFGWAMLIIL